MTVLIFLLALAAPQHFEIVSTAELTENASVNLLGFSGDAKRLFYLDKQSLLMRDLNTGQSQQLPSAAAMSFCALSPDDAFLYFVRWRASRHTLFRIPRTGGEAVQVATDAGPARFSPDGRTIAYFRFHYQTAAQAKDRVVSSSLVVANPDGSKERTLVSFDEPQRAWSVVWSPEGDRLAFLLGSTDGRGHTTQHLMATLLRNGETTELGPASAGTNRLIWPARGDGLYALEAHSEATALGLRVVHFPLPGGPWTSVADLSGSAMYNTVLGVSGDELLVATTRSHKNESFWDGVITKVLWKTAASQITFSELVLTRLRRK